MALELRVVVCRLGLVPYQDTLQAVKRFTALREPDSVDEFWLLQHHPVYTEGHACSQVPLHPTSIPVLKSDRGGQITHHGPGQIMYIF